MSRGDEVGFRFLAENSTDLICCAGSNMALRYASPSSLPLLGWQPEEMVGKRLDSFVLAEDASALAAVGGTHPGVLENSPLTVRLTKKDGTLAWMEIKHQVLRDAVTGEPRETVMVLRDLANRVPWEEGLSALTFTDSFPGLSTHQAFLKTLEREWNRALRESCPLSLLRLDFNDFRHFHSVEHHVTGDGCLAKVAAAVIGAIRITDYAARYGAEDIAIILPSTDAEGAARVVDKLRRAIAALRSPRHGDVEDCVPVSIGISTVIARSGGTMHMPEILLLAADHALHKSQYEEAKSRRPGTADLLPIARWNENGASPYA
jgi:diguanylate cyclase (GGDEF)-like protein/PAS domain S-box-containing protein